MPQLSFGGGGGGVSFGGSELRTRIVERALLRPGDHFTGPAIVREFSGTTLVPPRCRASVTAGGHLRLER